MHYKLLRCSLFFGQRYVNILTCKFKFSGKLFVKELDNSNNSSRRLYPGNSALIELL